jgi:hypothetical protein
MGLIAQAFSLQGESWFFYGSADAVENLLMLLWWWTYGI